MWRRKPTAAMRRDNVERLVRVESVAFTGWWELFVCVVPHEGRGRFSRVSMSAFLRKFEPVAEVSRD